MWTLPVNFQIPAVTLGHGLDKLQQVFQWRALDFDYPSEEIRQYAKFAKDFVPENNLPVGIEVWGNKLFITVPRWEDGKSTKDKFSNLASP